MGLPLHGRVARRLPRGRRIKRHGVGYRSARHFDILNENIVFHWRDTHFGYPANGAGTGNATPDKSTAATFNAYNNRRQAYEGVVLLNNLTSHDEVFPSNDAYALIQAYAQLGALDGIPMLMYGQEAGAQNDFATYGFSGITNNNRNWARYESNFGKSIPNFKRWNSMTNVWQNRDWTAQDLYGRINRARLANPALRGKGEYFLSRTGGLGMDPNIFAVAKYQQAGLPASQQNVVFAFANTDYTASATRSATFDLSASVPGGANWFGIEPGKTYNLTNELATDPDALVWTTDRTGADLIANGLFVSLTRCRHRTEPGAIPPSRRYQRPRWIPTTTACPTIGKLPTISILTTMPTPPSMPMATANRTSPSSSQAPIHKAPPRASPSPP